MRNFQGITALFSAATAAATSTVKMDVSDFRHIILAVATASSANFTLKIQGFIQDTPPDFSAAASPTNQWAYVQIKNLADGSTVNGATGVTSAGTDIQNMYEINTNGLKFVSATITARSAGAITVLVKPFNDQ